MTRSRDMTMNCRRPVRTWRRAPAPRADASPLGEFRPLKGFYHSQNSHSHTLSLTCLAERLHVYVLVHDTAVPWQVLIAECGEHHCLAITEVGPLWEEARGMEDGIAQDAY